MTTNAAKELVERGFAQWAAGEEDFFGLLADDVRWTITGSSPIAGTYVTRQEFLDGAIGSISPRLSQPIRPVVRSIVAEGDTVVVVWDGHATANDGQPYDNTYCWVLRIGDDKIVEATAFFDSPLVTDLLTRGRAAPER